MTNEIQPIKNDVNRVDKEEIERFKNMSIEELMKYSKSDIQDHVKEALIKDGTLKTQQQKDNIFKGGVNTKPIPDSMIVDTILELDKRNYIVTGVTPSNIYWDFHSLLNMTRSGHIVFSNEERDMFQGIAKYIQETQDIPLPTDDDIDNWLAYEEYNAMFKEYEEWTESVRQKNLIPLFKNTNEDGFIMIPDKFIRILIQSIKLSSIDAPSPKLQPEENEQWYQDIISWDSFNNENVSFSNDQREIISELFKSLMSDLNRTYQLKEEIK